MNLCAPLESNKFMANRVHKSSDIEQQPPFGDSKNKAIYSLKIGGSKNNIDTVELQILFFKSLMRGF